MARAVSFNSRAAAARTFLGLVCAGLVAANLYAQASIDGTVRDASGAVVPVVAVQAETSGRPQPVLSTITDEGGRYVFVDLPPRVYRLTFHRYGFTTLTRKGITLSGSFVATATTTGSGCV